MENLHVTPHFTVLDNPIKFLPKQMLDLILMPSYFVYPATIYLEPTSIGLMCLFLQGFSRIFIIMKAILRALKCTHCFSSFILSSSFTIKKSSNIATNLWLTRSKIAFILFMVIPGNGKQILMVKQNNKMGVECYLELNPLLIVRS